MHSDAQRFQIALAMTVLKHKPRDLSVADYLIELRKCFPVREGSKDEAVWKIRASELNGVVAGLKRKVDEDAAELALLRSQIPQGNASKTGKNPTKKRKDSAEENRAEGRERAVMEAPSNKGFSCLTGTHTRVLPSYLRLKELIDQASESGTSLKVSASILIAANHLIRTCSVQLVSSANASSNSLRALPNIRQLAETLASSFESISSLLRSVSGKKKQPKAAIDLCFKTVSQELAVPLVRCIPRSVHDAYAHLLLPPLSGTKKDSGCPRPSLCAELINILQHLLATFSALPQTLENLRAYHTPFLHLVDVVRHAALSEIQQLLDQPAGLDMPFGEERELAGKQAMRRQGKASRAQRIQRLARKDALCFLCSVLRMTVLPNILSLEMEVSRDSESSLEEFSRDKIEEALTSLLSRCARQRGRLSDAGETSKMLDEVERCMLMGVVESFWLSAPG